VRPDFTSTVHTPVQYTTTDRASVEIQSSDVRGRTAAELAAVASRRDY
jgi:hypothetical protein